MTIKTNNPQFCAGALWKLIDVNTATEVIKVYDGPCLFIGAIMQSGAAITILAIYDQAEGPVQTTKRAPGIKAPGGGYDGFINPLEMERGIICTLDAIDGLAWLFYVPA